MKTFKQFLFESKKSITQAKQIINQIADNHNDEDEIPFDKWEYKGDPDPEYHGETHMFDDHGVETHPIDSIIPGQRSFSKTGVDHYLDGKGDVERPLIGIKGNDGEIRLQDGHHRLMTKKLLGHKNVKVHVFATNEYHPENSENNH